MRPPGAPPGTSDGVTYGRCMRSIRRWGLPLVCALAGALAAPVVHAVPVEASRVGNPSDPQLREFYDQDIAWRACADRGPRVQCATVTVPLDYQRPTGRTIEIALVKLPATGASPRSLLVNPGGPGASGVDYVEYLGSVIDPDV